MNHLYWGDGKGKTTAAMGTALRALAAGWDVLVVQFLKGSTSGEITLLEQLGARIRRENPTGKFVFQMDDKEKQVTRVAADALLSSVAGERADLVILDEAVGAVAAGVLDEQLLQQTLEQWRNSESVQNDALPPEIIMTGRNPAQWMHEWADYDTEMRAIKHPYEQGICAREGIEW